MTPSSRRLARRRGGAAEPYIREFQAADLGSLRLPEAHWRVCELAGRRLPTDPSSRET